MPREVGQPRLVVPIGGFNRSGGVKTLVVLANAMAEHGWHVRMIAPDYAAASPFPIDPRVEVRVVGTGPLPRGARTVWYYARLALLAARDADVCLANFYLTAYCAFWSTRWPGAARAVYLLQGDEAESHGRLAAGSALGRWVRRTLARRSYRLPLRMLCVSDWLRRQVKRPDAIVIGQGIDLAVFHPASGGRTGTPVVGTIPSDAAVKGYGDVVAALTRLAGASYELALASASTEAEMAGFYRRCDVFVFASHREGFGLPPLEAMACGCAVVTTACGGVSDFVRDGVNCLVVPPEEPQALARAIERLLTDAALRSQLAAEGVRTAAAWPRARLVDAFIREMVVAA